MLVLKDSLQVGSSLYADGVQPELRFPLYQIHREGVKVCSIWLTRRIYGHASRASTPFRFFTLRSVDAKSRYAQTPSAFQNQVFLEALELSISMLQDQRLQATRLREVFEARGFD